MRAPQVKTFGFCFDSEHFPAKCIPVRVEKMRQIKRLEPFPDSIEAGNALVVATSDQRMDAVITATVTVTGAVLTVPMMIGGLSIVLHHLYERTRFRHQNRIGADRRERRRRRHSGPVNEDRSQ